jgi:hypothetical protein
MHVIRSRTSPQICFHLKKGSSTLGPWVNTVIIFHQFITYTIISVQIVRDITLLQACP